MKKLNEESERRDENIVGNMYSDEQLPLTIQCHFNPNMYYSSSLRNSNTTRELKHEIIVQRI